MGKLIMPKQTAEVTKMIYTLEVLYEAYQSGQPVVSNYDYKQAIIKKVTSFNKDSNSAMLVKQSEMARYFGLAVGNFKKHNIQITARGIEFYKAYLANDREKQISLLVDSINSLTFGRNNSAMQDSDSDIDPPKLFIKSIMSLNGINRAEFAALLSLTNDLELTFQSALAQIVESRREYQDITIPKKNINKYKDSKFPKFLVEMGLCYLDEKKRYRLSAPELDSFLEVFDKMSIYNAIPEMLKDLTFDNYDDDSSSDTYKKKVENTLGYDIGSTAFRDQNSRIPLKNVKSKITEKYKTNPRIGKTALELAEHKCEFDYVHQTFLNKSLVRFMEPHHLIPMSAQKDFSENLDCVENIVSLCPNCHSAIHYGHAVVREEILLKIYKERIDQLVERGLKISFENLFKKYYK